MGALFDAYVIVDWSAASTPKKGADSIWYCVVEQGEVQIIENVPTRKEAFDDLTDILSDYQARGLKVLLGFDFSFGYPKGFAKALGLGKENWQGIWREISGHIQDDEKNSNNRFDVANGFNERMGEGPFWGCPQKQSFDNLGPKKPKSSQMLDEKRLCEQRISGVKPVWQLLGTGCVGSQTLMGIAWLEKIRTHPWFANDIQVWPFETGLKSLARLELPTVTIAEIYPSQIKMDVKEGEVKDMVQVRTLALHYSEMDQAEELAELFEADEDLSPEEKEVITTEEGWVLGVGKSNRQKCDHWMASYIRKPDEIYKKSEQLILEKLDVSDIQQDMQDVIIRMVHSIGEPAIKEDILFSKNAAKSGSKALKSGKPVFVDVEMVSHGIISKRLPVDNEVRCHLNDENIPALATEMSTTRSAAALENWGADLDGAVVVIGNAPTALFHLLQGLLDKRLAKPALVIGCPVGFVGAAESKECLIEYADELNLAYITIKGQRGGSALAAAALNGLAKKGIIQ